MVDEQGSFKIEIDRNWSSRDFAEIFSSLDFLYDAAFLSNASAEDFSFSPYRFLRRREGISGYYDPYLPPQYEHEIDSLLLRSELRNYFSLYGRTGSGLKVRAIRFGSRGFFDLAGAGKIVEEIRKFSIEILDRYLAKEDRKLAREDKRQDIFSKKLKNAEALLRIKDELKFADEDLRRLLVKEVLQVDHLIESKIIDGKIISIDGKED